MDKEPITTDGLESLKEELIFLKEKKRPQIVAAISEARSHGDLKENAEYHAAKEEQSHNEGRITEINDIIARANVIVAITNTGLNTFGSICRSIICCRVRPIIFAAVTYSFSFSTSVEPLTVRAKGTHSDKPIEIIKTTIDISYRTSGGKIPRATP